MSTLEDLPEESDPGRAPAVVEGVALPALVLAAGGEAARHFLNFFVASIRNRNTRRAYVRQTRDFLLWAEGRGLGGVRQVRTEHAAAYVELLTRDDGETSSVKQALAALRMLFDWLVVNQVVPASPFAAVKGPRLVVDEGKTSCLDGTQVVELFEATPTDSLVGGLRDRALVGLMAYTFARVGAALATDVGDYWREGKAGQVRLREKDGKRRTLAVHHVLEGYLDQYLAAAGIVGERGTPLFRTAKGRTGGLTGNRMEQADAWRMLRRRAKTAGLDVALCNHTWRATGITNYLENGGALETARWMAGHGDPVPEAQGTVVVIAIVVGELAAADDELAIGTDRPSTETPIIGDGANTGDNNLHTWFGPNGTAYFGLASDEVAVCEGQSGAACRTSATPRLGRRRGTSLCRSCNARASS